eukprot:UN04418
MTGFYYLRYRSFSFPNALPSIGCLNYFRYYLVIPYLASHQTNGYHQPSFQLVFLKSLFQI